MQLTTIQTLDGIETLCSIAHALRPARIIRDQLHHFTGTTFPDGPYEGCELILRRMSAFGMIPKADTEQWVDVLDEHGDILHEVPLTISGFEYLRGKLKFVREKG